MPPSVHSTHCSGPGLLPTTPVWSQTYRAYRRYLSEIPDTLPMPLPHSAGHDLRNKTVIISGSNSGIGKQAALHFARCGATVILACRLTAKHEQHPEDTRKEILEKAKVDEDKVEVWEIDCSSLESVRRFGERWRQSGRRCDILVNNAGLSAGKRVITQEGFELTNAVNFLSHTLLTFYVLPSMRTSAAPRIINTCSCFHAGGDLDFSNFNNELQTSGGPNGVQWYCDTKLRLLIWTVELQHRLSRSQEYRHVIAHGVHPGFVASNIWKNPDFSHHWVLDFGLTLLMAKWSIDEEQGSFVLVHAATHPDLGLPRRSTDKDKEEVVLPEPGVSALFGGKYVNRNKVDERRPECEDPLVRSRLWQRVLEDTKAEELGLTEGIPGHLEEVLLIE